MLKAYAATTANPNQVVSDTAIELSKLLELIITKIPLWIAALIVILMSFIGAKLVRGIVENKLAERGIEEEHQELQILGGRIAYSSVLTLGITVGLKIAGIDLTTILAAVAFGIGFALKDLIMNFLAGVMILLSRHFTIGDFIKVGTTIGKVEEIQSRVTILKAIDGTKVIVPNGDMFKKQVTSFTSNPFRKIQVCVEVDYRSNLENVLNVCMDTVKNTKGILMEPKPAVVVDNFGESGIGIKVKAWVDSRGGWVKVKSDLSHNIKKAFDAHGIVIPWPIRTVVEDKDQKMEEKIMEIQKDVEDTKEPEVQITGQVNIPAASNKPALATVPITEEVEEQPLKPLGEMKNNS